jgi:hypothetical protein
MAEVKRSQQTAGRATRLSVRARIRAPSQPNQNNITGSFQADWPTKLSEPTDSTHRPPYEEPRRSAYSPPNVLVPLNLGARGIHVHATTSHSLSDRHILKAAWIVLLISISTRDRNPLLTTAALLVEPVMQGCDMLARFWPSSNWPPWCTANRVRLVIRALPAPLGGLQRPLYTGEQCRCSLCDWIVQDD